MQFIKKREIQLKDLLFQNAVQQEEGNTAKRYTFPECSPTRRGEYS
jgi:hypothetical protein